MGLRTIACIVGTRPNFMKIAPVVSALTAHPHEFRHVLIHTEQHYDAHMSAAFLDELGLGEPHYRLDVGSGSHAQQTGRAMQRLERVLAATEPDLVLVPGDVNSSLAAALVGAQLRIPIGHIEAGLRSFDRSMPEELNRILIDQVSDLLFTHSVEAGANLLAEGRPTASIHFVGNTMIDTLTAMRSRISLADAPTRHGLAPGSYIVVTLHRPSLVDEPLLFAALLELNALSRHFEIVFPVHPRTRTKLEASDAADRYRGLRFLDPLGYFDFLNLLEHAAAVVTDSGGVQEETTFLGVPCFTLRSSTERPVTCELGTNLLLGLEPRRIAEIPTYLSDMRRTPPSIPPLWDGQAAARIVDVLRRG